MVFEAQNAKDVLMAYSEHFQYHNNFVLLQSVVLDKKAQ